jgi:hypothetical protein
VQLHALLQAHSRAVIPQRDSTRQTNVGSDDDLLIFL